MRHFLFVLDLFLLALVGACSVLTALFAYSEIFR